MVSEWKVKIYWFPNVNVFPIDLKIYKVNWCVVGTIFRVHWFKLQLEYQKLLGYQSQSDRVQALLQLDVHHVISFSYLLALEIWARNTHLKPSKLFIVEHINAFLLPFCPAFSLKLPCCAQSHLRFPTKRPWSPRGRIRIQSYLLVSSH